MTRKLLPILALAATAAVPATSALAASSTTPATKADMKVEGGYAYYDSFKPLNKRLIMVVVKTHGQMPRRFDGLIRAGGTFNSRAGGSVGAVGGKQSKCYTFMVPLKDGKYFYPADGSQEGHGPAAKPGRFTVTMSAKDADGNRVSASKTINLRDRKVGDRVGKPLGC